MSNVSTNSPDGSPTQKMLLFRGQRAVQTVPLLAYASLAAGQTIIDNVAGVTYTLVADDLAGGTLPLATVAIAARINGLGTSAFTWVATATGFTITAKTPDSAHNTLITGTALASVSVISTVGTDPIASQWGFVQKSRKDQLLDETALDLGGFPSGYTVWWDDFCKYSDGTNRLPATEEFPWQINLTTATPWRKVPSGFGPPDHVGNADGIYDNSGNCFASNSIASNRFRLTVRMKTSASTGTIFAAIDGTFGFVGVGCWADSPASATKFYGMSFPYTYYLDLPKALAGFTELGDRDANYHELSIEGDGAGRIRFRMDTRPWTAWAACTYTLGAAPVINILRSGGASMTFDYVFFALGRE